MVLRSLFSTIQIAAKYRGLATAGACRLNRDRRQDFTVVPVVGDNGYGLAVNVKY